jgi:hypothetical protein
VEGAWKASAAAPAESPANAAAPEASAQQQYTKTIYTVRLVLERGEEPVADTLERVHALGHILAQRHLYIKI